MCKTHLKNLTVSTSPLCSLGLIFRTKKCSTKKCSTSSNQPIVLDTHVAKVTSHMTSSSDHVTTSPGGGTGREVFMASHNGHVIEAEVLSERQAKVLSYSRHFRRRATIAAGRDTIAAGRDTIAAARETDEHGVDEGESSDEVNSYHLNESLWYVVAWFNTHDITL